MKILPLKNRKGVVVAQVKIDDAWYPVLSQLSWHWCPPAKSSGGSVRTCGSSLRHGIIGGFLHLARVVCLEDPRGRKVVYRDHDPLNCQESNLRVATASEKTMQARKSSLNTSGVKGVSFSRRDNRWIAGIGFAGKWEYLGGYGSIDEAAAVVARARLKYHGDFARES